MAKGKKRGRKPGPLHYHIQKDVPITMRASSRLNAAYPILNEMEVHESFTFPLNEGNSVRSARVYIQKGGEKRFITRVVSKKPPIGRIWRIADGTVLMTRRRKK